MVLSKSFEAYSLNSFEKTPQTESECWRPRSRRFKLRHNCDDGWSCSDARAHTMTVCLLQHVRTHRMWHCNGESMSCSNARSQDGKGNFLRKLELFFMDAVLGVTFLTASRLKLITTMTRLVLTRVCCLTRVGAQKKCIIIAPAVHLFVSGPHNSYSHEIWNKSKTSCWYYLEESGKLCGVSVLPWWELKQDHLS